MKRQFSYIGFYAAILLLASIVIPACSTMGYENVDTTRKAILVADAEIRGANMLLRDLVQRRSIDTASAGEALTALRTAHTANQAALDAVTLSGDPLTGQDRLIQANRALGVALTLISQFTDQRGTP